MTSPESTRCQSGPGSAQQLTANTVSYHATQGPRDAAAIGTNVLREWTGKRLAPEPTFAYPPE